MTSNNTTGRNGAGSKSASDGVLAAMAPRRALWWGVLCLALFAALLPRETTAATNAPASIHNRYLLIVQTSRSMQHRSEGVVQVIQELFSSAMNGQLLPGDTIGLWTYNDRLHGGQFRLQHWLPNSQQQITARLLGYLQAQKFENSARLEKVLPVMSSIINKSDFITVILITDGAQEMHGTPFDDKINAAYSAWRDQQRANRMPFVTVLRAKGGAITDYCANPAPWTPALPPLPKELLAAQEAPKPAPVVTHHAPAATVAPLIFIGRKPVSQTTLQTETAKATGSTATADQLANTSPATASNGPAGTPSSTASVTSNQQPANLKSIAPVAAAATEPAGGTGVLASTTGASSAGQDRTVSPEPLGQSVKTGASAASGTAQPVSPIAPKTALEVRGHSDMPKLVASAASPLSPPAQTTPSNRISLNPFLWLAGGGCFGLALGMIWLWRVRTRSTGPISVITRSMERGFK
ncbi:MAG TPA: hypothetical protein VG146_06530 [Verrucomicrobiae bacterium]|nr:hypothetical protein [Verrucomicrobiae bacterium]